MGLMGLARRAGRARGAYMAAQEEYRRNREAMLDRRQDRLDQSLLNMRRQQMGISAAGERRAQAAFDANQKWLAEQQSNTRLGWKRDAERFGWDKAAEARKQAKFEQNQKAAAAKLDAANAAQTQRKQVWDMMSDDERIAAVYPYSRYAGLPGMVNGANNRPDRPNRTYRQNAGTDGATREAGNGAGKPVISDNLLKANAEAVTPERMQMAFSRKFYDTDENIQKRTGMKRDQFMKTLADQYKAHILSAGANAMNEDDFIRQAVGRYGFWDVDDLGRLWNAMNDAGSANPTKHGFGWFGLGRRNAEEEYARRNPAFYKQQKALITDVAGIEGIDPDIKIKSLRNPVFVRNYRMGRERGLAPAAAFRYADEKVRRGAR